MRGGGRHHLQPRCPSPGRQVTGSARCRRRTGDGGDCKAGSRQGLETTGGRRGRDTGSRRTGCAREHGEGHPHLLTETVLGCDGETCRGSSIWGKSLVSMKAIGKFVYGSGFYRKPWGSLCHRGSPRQGRGETRTRQRQRGREARPICCGQKLPAVSGKRAFQARRIYFQNTHHVGKTINILGGWAVLTHNKRTRPLKNA